MLLLFSYHYLLCFYKLVVLFRHCKSMANTNKCPSGFWTKKSRRNRKIPFLRLLKGYSFHLCTFCHLKWQDHHPIFLNKKWNFLLFLELFFFKSYFSGISIQHRRFFFFKSWPKLADVLKKRLHVFKICEGEILFCLHIYLELDLLLSTQRVHKLRVCHNIVSSCKPNDLKRQTKAFQILHYVQNNNKTGKLYGILNHPSKNQPWLTYWFTDAIPDF